MFEIFRMFGAGCYLFWIRNIIFDILVSTHEDEIHLMANITHFPQPTPTHRCLLPVAGFGSERGTRFNLQRANLLWRVWTVANFHGLFHWPHVGPWCDFSSWLWYMASMSMPTGITGNLNLWHALKVRLSRVSWHRKGQKRTRAEKGMHFWVSASNFVIVTVPLCTVSVYMILWKKKLTNHYQ